MLAATSTATAPQPAPPRIDLDTAARLTAEPVIPELVEPLRARAARDLDMALDALSDPLGAASGSAPGAASGASYGPALRRDLVDWYAQGVARLSNLVLLQRFSGFQLLRNPLWRPGATRPGDAPEGAPRASLDAYIAWERQENLFDAGGPYPELARLVETWRTNWLVGCGKLVERFVRHRHDMPSIADAGPEPRLVRARFGISDPHEGGQTAAILELTDGFRGISSRGVTSRVVYKPRSVQGEALWSQMSRRVLEPGLGLPMEGLRVIVGDGYGFMEFVEHDAAEDLDAIDRAYRRYGGVLALAHALGTIDLHHENVIVRGEHPLVIDAEPLLRARLRLSDQGESRMAFERNLSLEGLDARESVLELGILPMAIRSPLPLEEGGEAREVEFGALLPYGKDPLDDFVPCGRGSDLLQLRRVQVSADEFPSIPRLQDEARLPLDHVEALESGFVEVHRWLEANRQDLFSDAELRRRLGRAKLRFLARPTMEYATVLGRSLAPEFLRSTEVRRRRIEDDLAVLGAQRFDDVAAMVPAEAESLAAGDIPRFEVAGDQDSFDTGTGDSDSDENRGRVQLLESPLAAASHRIGGLDENDRRLQSAIVRERLRRPEQSFLPDLPRGTDAESLRSHAFAVVQSLYEAALDGDAPTWAVSSFAPGFGSTMVHDDRESLYEGAAGTAVVLAEAGRLADRSDWRRMAADVFAPLYVRRPMSLTRGAGIARGLGGLLYAMVRVADACGDEALLDLAVRLATEHGPALAEAPGLDELLNGRTGLLLATLAVQRRRPTAALEELSDRLAKTLLGNARRDERGVYWAPEGGLAMPNVSHGTSGIAMALARYGARRDHCGAVQGALGALRFDDTSWLPEEHGWCDLRLDPEQSPQRTSWSWCNGRSGALLARQEIRESLGVELMGPGRDAFDAAPTDALEEASPGLCCGTPGVIDCLATLRPSDAVEAARQRAIALLAGGSLPSHYSTLSPSLFTGTAGLAFALMRAACPDRVASLVAFD